MIIKFKIYPNLNLSNLENWNKNRLLLTKKKKYEYSINQTIKNDYIKDTNLNIFAFNLVIQGFLHVSSVLNHIAQRRREFEFKS